MKHLFNRMTKAALAAAAFAAASANAEYRCAPPPTRIDRLACEAAQQGPDALARFIHRMRGVENLYFPDYVDKATLIAWEQKEQAEREQARLKAVAQAADDKR
jgi:hypothetical protein